MTSGADGLGPDLSEGAAGTSIFLDYVDRVGILPIARPASIRHAQHAFTALARVPMTMALHGGMAGILFMGQHVEGLPSVVRTDLVDAVLEPLATVLAKPDWTGELDLVAGLAGVGVAALECPTTLGLQAAIDVVKHYTVLARPKQGVVRWSQTTCDKGEIDLGMAHGVAGAMSFLTGAVARTGDETARTLLQATTRWLAEIEERSHGFPAFHVAGEQLPPARLAWCYGDAGISLAFLNASRACGQRSLERMALEVGIRASRRKVHADSGVEDDGLCHGTAGLVLLFCRLYNATGDEAFATAARYWVTETLRRRRPSIGIAGFGSGPRDSDPRGAEVGLLRGAAGVGLCLLAAATEVAPDWDRCLGLSHA